MPLIIPDARAFGGRPTPPSAGVPTVRVGERSQVGEALVGVGQSLGEIAGKIQRREDSVARARALRKTREAIEEKYHRSVSEMDAGDKTTWEGFERFIADTKAGALQNFSGSADAAAQLSQDLEGLHGQYTQQAQSTYLSAIREEAEGVVLDDMSELAGQARMYPERVDDLILEGQRRLRGHAGILPEGREVELNRAVRSSLYKSAIQGMFMRGAYSEVLEKIISTPGLLADMTLGDQQWVFDQIGGFYAKQREAAIEAKKPIKLSPGDYLYDPGAGKFITGVPNAPEPVKGIPRPLFDSLPPSVRMSILAGDSETPPFGTGASGRVLQQLSDNAIKFGTNELSATEEARFLAAVTEYTQPYTKPDPFTGESRTYYPVLPDQVVLAFKQRGMDLPGRRGAEGGDVSAPSAKSVPGLHGKTVGELALNDWVTGLMARGKEIAGRTPIVGPFFGAERETVAQQYVDTIKRDLVRVLQNSPKYAEGERKAIEDDINISGQVFDNAQAYIQRLVGMSAALDTRYQNAINVANSKIGREERIHALNVASAIENFKGNLLPPIALTREEAEKFARENPAGTKVLTKNKNGEWAIFEVEPK